MSFSSDAKQELVRQKMEKHCCMLSELSGVTQSCASLRLLGGGRFTVVYQVENTALAKRILLLLKLRLEIRATLQFSKHPRLGGRRICTLMVGEADSKRLLMALHMLRQSDAGSDIFRSVPRAALSRRCCRQAFLRGAFLGGGAVTTPEKGYHREFTVAGEQRAEAILHILEKSGVHAQTTQRRGAVMVYVKRGDDVATLLAMMGAAKALMAMENERIRRDSRNQANRAMNCDQANMIKQITAAQQQAAQITRFSLQHGLGGLKPPLQELARIRMLNPDASLEQLGQLVSPQLSKSGVNHRMRRLMEIIQTVENQSNALEG